MKKNCLIFCVLLMNVSFIYAQSFSTLVNYRHQHNPRAEAMGRSHTGLEGDINSILFNPLTIAYLDDVQFSFCSSSPFGDNPLSTVSFLALGTKVNESFKIGLAYRNITQPYPFFIGAINDTPLLESATLAFGFRLSKHTYLALGSHFLYSRNYSSGFWEPFLIGYQALGLNNHIGFSWKYFLKNKRNFFTSSLKANWNYNLNDNFSSEDNPWSINFTIGSSFHYTSNKLIFDKYNAFRFISTVELTKDLSESANQFEDTFYLKFSLGNEFTILDYLSLRLGFVYWNISLPFTNELNKRYGFTYGLGVKLPVHEFINQQRPINFYLDYCYLPQYFYNNINPDSPNETHNFQDISLRMSVNLKK